MTLFEYIEARWNGMCSLIHKLQLTVYGTDQDVKMTHKKLTVYKHKGQANNGMQCCCCSCESSLVLTDG